MTFRLTDAEWARVRLLPRQDLVELAAALDLVIPAEVDKRDLLEACVPRLVALGVRDGLPFTAYDEEDLAELSPDGLAAVARMQGSPATVRDVLRAGERVFKARERERGGRDPVAMLLPSCSRRS